MPIVAEHKVDIFKALGHPTRREILKLIAKKGAVSYKELTKIEPKAGVLYHHLRLLGDLIYQDENKLYRLTDRGYKALDFMDTFLYIPVDRGIHKYFTPRQLIEKIEGTRNIIFIVILYLVSLITFLMSPDYVEFFIFLAPMSNLIIHPLIIALISWSASAVIIRSILKIVYDRGVPLTDLAIKLTPGFTLVNFTPLILTIFSENSIVEGIIYTIMQMFSLLIIISAVSVAGKISLRKSGLIVIILHYMGILTYLALLNIT